MLTFFLLAGRYLDHRTRAVARSAAEELAALEVPRATVLRDGVELVLVISEPTCGGRSGAGAPRRADAGRWRGDRRHVELDRSLLTGESLPAFAGPGTSSARAR
jgi:P-type Cu2+ transporter